MSDAPDWTNIPGAMRYLGEIHVDTPGTTTYVLPFTPASYDGGVLVVPDGNYPVAMTFCHVSMDNLDTGTTFDSADLQMAMGAYRGVIVLFASLSISPNWQVRVFLSPTGPAPDARFYVFALPTMPFVLPANNMRPLKIQGDVNGAPVNVYISGYTYGFPMPVDAEIIAPLAQHPMATSIPVVVASNQSAFPVNASIVAPIGNNAVADSVSVTIAWDEPAHPTDATIVGPLGQAQMINSVPVVVASNQSAISANVTIVGPLGQKQAAASVPIVNASNSSRSRRVFYQRNGSVIGSPAGTFAIGAAFGPSPGGSGYAILHAVLDIAVRGAAGANINRVLLQVTDGVVNFEVLRLFCHEGAQSHSEIVPPWPIEPNGINTGFPWTVQVLIQNIVGASLTDATASIDWIEWAP